MNNPNFVTLASCRREDRILVYHQQRILFRDGRYTWSLTELRDLLNEAHLPVLVNESDRRYLAVHVDEDFQLPDDAEFISLRRLVMEKPAGEFQIPGLGNQLTSWYRSHRYCGTCGSPTRPHHGERALSCPACELSYYPRINPCVIMLVTDGKRMLLAQHTRYRASFYSCLAGFIEVGETPEETVAREVKEEAGIEITNIRYAQSQSWPFPSQLMLGFYADYLAGELCPEPGEIEDLKWFTPEDVPNTPSAGISVAGRLIRDHCRRWQRDRNR